MKCYDTPVVRRIVDCIFDIFKFCHLRNIFCIDSMSLRFLLLDHVTELKVAKAKITELHAHCTEYKQEVWNSCQIGNVALIMCDMHIHGS